ncbi:glucuronate isomerase [Actinoplanes sp. RD1]|uniref:glucuronate isomerase n=1 Tax=Actinoplanes sp. RD1 TaxID=3064538 RepID=UPI002740EF29|nr:glucuronate isomerase [Actinoplanes sp. RD1]
MAPHPDRLLPPDPAVRDIARRLYTAVRDLPIISPHGHVDPRLLLDDLPFTDPAALFIQPDHYVTRLLHAGGVSLSALGVGSSLSPARSREAWRTLCEHWHLLRGTPVHYWLSSSLASFFGITSRPSAGNADALYDQIAGQALRPRSALASFGLSFLATTDDPASDLAVHDALQPVVRVAPTFRPDRYFLIDQPGWPALVSALGDYASFLAWLAERRQYFIAHGAVSADHGHVDAGTSPLSSDEAARIYRAGLDGSVTAAEAAAFRRHMIFESARMSCDDGLVMTLHPGVYRNHSPATFARYGPDTGHDIPVATEFTRALQPLLDRFGTYPGFHLVLFTVDPTAYAREIAPLAGFYPSVYAGAPWWFLDNPSEIRNFQRAVTETAGFSRLSGFIDDTRALLSIPARHDMSRRLDAGHLASLVAEHRLDEDEAHDTLHALVADQPRTVFKL